jgi:uncharacterized protein HemX
MTTNKLKKFIGIASLCATLGLANAGKNPEAQAKREAFKQEVKAMREDTRAKVKATNDAAEKKKLWKENREAIKAKKDALDKDLKEIKAEKSVEKTEKK